MAKRSDHNKPVGIYLVPYLYMGKLLYKVRATYRGPAVKDLADGFKTVAAAKKWYTNFICDPRSDKAQAKARTEREGFLAMLAEVPGVTVRRY